MINIRIDTADEAVSAMHCFKDLAAMDIDPIFVHDTSQEAIGRTYAELEETMQKYEYARKRAVDLRAERVTEFPENIRLFMKDKAGKYVKAFAGNEIVCSFYRGIEKKLATPSS